MFWAKELHKGVNHQYDGKPYDYHLTMCQQAGMQFIHLIPEIEIDTIFSAIWLHDTIEDCRVTYNDIKNKVGKEVAEIVYAVSNEKGKTRKERANDKYYDGINAVPYASFVKICDRIANMEYSALTKSLMVAKYQNELSEFKYHLGCKLYTSMFDYMEKIR